MKLKRIMAIVLCLAMVLSTMGTVAFAAEETVVATVGGVDYSSFTEVLDAVKASTGNEVTLLADVSASGQNALDALTGDTIDLNNKTLTVEETNTYFSDGTTTFTNGNIVVKGYSSDSPFCGYTENAVIVFDDVVIKGDDYSTACALFNANRGKVEIKNSEITVSGDTTGGIVYGGAATIDGTSINATNVCRGITNSVAEIKNSSAFTFDGGETGFNNSTVTVDASEVTIKNATKRAVRLDDNTLALQNGATLTATGCVEDIVAYDEESTAVVNVDDSSTLEAVNNIVPGTPVTNAVATVDGEKFTDLQEAIKAAAPGGTVEIIDDVTVDKWIMFAETMSIGNGNLITLNINGLTIDGNGNTLTIKSIESAGNGNRLFFDAQNLNIKDLTIEYIDDAANQGGIGLQSGTLSDVNFVGGGYGVLPGEGDITITGCNFKTNSTAIYYEVARDNLEVDNNTFELADNVNVILLRGNGLFTNNTVVSGRTVNVVSGSPVVTGNDFGNVRFKVYNVATATIKDNEINVLEFSDDSEVNSTFSSNTLSDDAVQALEAVGAKQVVTGLKGTGSAEDPYLINNLDELNWFRDNANAGNSFSGKTVKLTDDIDLGGVTWTPIKNFLGTFDGDNHTISNFHLDATNDHAGFFYKLNFGNGTAIKDLTLSDITATVGNYYVGALAYFSFAVQDNITIKNFTVTTTSSEANIGGYAGWVEWGHIRNCTIENFVVNAENGAGLIGGLAAVLKADSWLQYNNIDVKGIKVNINDTDEKYAEVGGLVGQTQTGHDAPVFTNCDISGIDVTATGLVTVGGFIARPGAHTTAKNCTTEGTIDVTGVTSANESAGGFFGNLGWNNNESSRGGHKLTNCSANVDIITKIASAGGFVGSATNEQTRNMAVAFANCSASGNVTAVEGGTANIGGFAGAADRGTYAGCSASGTLTNNGTGEAGQFIGAVEKRFDVKLTDCAYTGASTELDFIGYTADDANVEIGVSAAKIGDTYFKTFEAALNAVADGQTITLLGGTSSDELSKEIDFTKDISFTITGIAPEYALPVVTFQNATVTIKDAEILIPELDARQDATINVVDSIVHDAGGNSIVKSYYNGAINISGTSVVYTMQVTTMGYITVSDTAKLNATWQTNVYGNGLITVEDDAALVTAALQLTAKDYNNRDNTDSERVGKPAAVVVDGATLTVGKVYSDSGADYSYNSSHGINIGTIAGKKAVLDAKNGAKVNIYMDKNQSVNVGADGTVNVADSSLITACRAADGEMTFVNNGTVNVSGTSDIAAKVTGSGWVYMDGVTLDADTKLNGANVRFASGTNNIDGSVIDNGKFQVGIGAYNGVDSRVDTVNGVIVNVKNATIGSKDGAYAGWIGTGYYDTDAEKTAAMTDAEYVLNIENSIAEFGYLHISNDGVLNVKGNATEKANYNGSDYSFRGGDFIVNGTATFDATDVLAIDTKISCDNGTTTPGTLNIVNGTTYEAERHNGAIAGNTFRLFKTGVANVDEASELYIGEPSSVAADAVMNINGKVTALGEITNNGTINVAEDASLAANGSVKVNGTLKSTGDISGTITKTDGAAIEITGGTYTQDVAAWCPNGYICENNGDGTYSVINTTPSAYTVTVKASEEEVRYNKNNTPDTFTVEYIVTGGNVIGAMAQYNYDNILFTCAEDDDNDGKLILYNNDLTTAANGETVIAKLTFTVNKDVEVDTTYKFLAEKVQVTSDYDAAGSGAQDGFVENVVGDEVTVVAQWKVTLPDNNSLTGNTYVDKNTDYSATINNFDENMTYTIKYTMGNGEEQTIEVTKENAVDNGFIIEDVTGDIVFTDVSYELNCEIVLVPDYVNGCTLVIVKDGVANGYTYDNAPMYPVARYEGITELPATANSYIVGNILNATSVRAILIEGAVNEAQARALIKAADSEPDDIEKSFDVNGNGSLFFNDAMTAHGCYKEQYDLALELAYYLRADVDTDLKIRTLDYDATVGAILDELYGN